MGSWWEGDVVVIVEVCSLLELRGLIMLMIRSSWVIKTRIQMARMVIAHDSEFRIGARRNCLLANDDWDSDWVGIGIWDGNA
jgi:hypothetical protein